MSDNGDISESLNFLVTFSLGPLRRRSPQSCHVQGSAKEEQRWRQGEQKRFRYVEDQKENRKFGFQRTNTPYPKGLDTHLMSVGDVETFSVFTDSSVTMETFLSVFHGHISFKRFRM